jgi:hypothetical protein
LSEPGGGGAAGAGGVGGGGGGGGRRGGGLSRRRVLGGGAVAAGWALAAGALAGRAAAGTAAPGALGAGLEGETPAAAGRGGGAGSARERRVLAARTAAARLQEDLPAAAHAVNGDEAAIPGFAACYSKGLPHDAAGAVDAAAYRVLLRALGSGDPADFEVIPLGGYLKLANPQAGLAFNLMGPDPARLELAPPPRFAGGEQAGEMVELYWQALLRDVAFGEYETHPLARRAAEDLSRIGEFRGPRGAGGRVTAATLFRGPGAANLAGPYLSQFLYKDIFLPPMWVPQRVRTAAPGLEYLMSHDGWLACQNGALSGVNRFDEHPRHVRNGRDLGEFVHRDFTYQAALDACLVLLKMGAPASGANPYKHSRTQSGFATFGAPYLFYLLAVVTQVALTASWYQKWWVHRRLRPEEYAGRVEAVRGGRAAYPVPAAVLGSAGLGESAGRHGTALLPQAYPEGCPAHPSYPAAHAVIAGAGVTVLKAFFDDSWVVPKPMVATADGLALEAYGGPPLTVGGELDKLAWNIGMGRNFAGIHWRSDVGAGVELGERAAIEVLREVRLTGNEVFSGFSLRRFGGERVRI